MLFFTFYIFDGDYKKFWGKKFFEGYPIIIGYIPKMYRYEYLNAFYTLNNQGINMINNESNINKNKINIKNNESNFEIADKNSESNLGDVVRDIISTEKKDNLKNEILKIQTFREEFEKEAVKKEFENKKSIIEKVEELKNKWDLEDKELKLTREFEDKLLEITRTHEDKEKENKRLMEDIKKKHEREIILKEMEIKALKIENEELEKKIELNNGSNFFIGKKRDISEA